MGSVNGIIYIAYGEPARLAAVKSIETLRKVSALPISIISDAPLMDNCNFVKFESTGFGARDAKLHIPELVDYTIGLYLDADTLIHESIATGFNIIEDGWDIAIAPSKNQGSFAFSHLELEERELMNPYQLQLQGGMFFYHRERCRQFFQVWLEEWRKWKHQDQGALIRALESSPLRVYLLGRPWNGGSIIEHNFGGARGV